MIKQSTHERDLSRFYAVIGQLSGRGHQRLLGSCNGHDDWPRRGVYFFTELGEFRSGPPNVLRIVRVGTHAVSAGSKSTLWGRLRAHRGGREGRGNHRGSIFRLHVGHALLARDQEELA